MGTASNKSAASKAKSAERAKPKDSKKLTAKTHHDGRGQSGQAKSK
jgi:hypothetical protein